MYCILNIAHRFNELIVFDLTGYFVLISFYVSHSLCCLWVTLFPRNKGNDNLFLIYFQDRDILSLSDVLTLHNKWLNLSSVLLVSGQSIFTSLRISSWCGKSLLWLSLKWVLVNWEFQQNSISKMILSVSWWHERVFILLLHVVFAENRMQKQK